MPMTPTYGPLSRGQSNPRYFADAAGRPASCCSTVGAYRSALTPDGTCIFLPAATTSTSLIFRDRNVNVACAPGARWTIRGCWPCRRTTSAQSSRHSTIATMCCTKSPTRPAALRTLGRSILPAPVVEDRLRSGGTSRVRENPALCPAARLDVNAPPALSLCDTVRRWNAEPGRPRLRLVTARQWFDEVAARGPVPISESRAGGAGRASPPALRVIRRRRPTGRVLPKIWGSICDF